MYIGSTGLGGLHHLVWEVVDNSVDEAMAGYCDRIDVTLLADGGCRVVDNGRGIPTDVTPSTRLPGVEIALTSSHGGGKFGGSGYKVSGGLHGVGVSVVNALSSRLIVEVDRDGQRHRMEFVNGGKPRTKLEVVGTAAAGPHAAPPSPSGPTPRSSRTIEFRAQTILERLQMYAFLNAGPRDPLPRRAPGRRADPVDLQVRRRHHRLRQPPQRVQGAAVQEGRLLQAGRGRGRGRGRLPVEHRLLPRPPRLRQRHRHHRGRHAREGFKKALTNVVNKYARAKDLLKEKDENLSARTSARA